MARVTAQGIEPTTLHGYIDALEAAFRSALGQDLDLAPETPAGQLVGTLALTLTEADGGGRRRWLRWATACRTAGRLGCSSTIWGLC